MGGGFTVDEINQIKVYTLDSLKQLMVDSAVDVLLEKSGGLFLYMQLLEDSFAQLAK